MIEVATHSVADRHAELPPPLTEESIPSFDFSEVYRPALAGANKIPNGSLVYWYNPYIVSVYYSIFKSI